MAPRFMERIGRQAQTLRNVFGEPQFDPPPYPVNRSSRSASDASQPSSLSKPLSTPPPQYTNSNQPVHIAEQLAIPRDSLILVTGANSWHGLHIVDQLLKHGYRVRGTVRDAEKAVWTCKFFKDKYGVGRYTTTIIQDMSKQFVFDIAIRGCAGIIHVASVTTPSSNPNVVITPSIAGAINALEAALKEPVMKRFVLTSSVLAAVSCDRGARTEITSDSWNMLDFEAAWATPPYGPERVRAVHAASKMQTEAAVWRWYHNKKPSFTINTVLPDTLWGQTLAPRHQPHPPSIQILKQIYTTNPEPHAPAWTVDVTDSALLHLAALTLPDLKGQRLFAVATPWNVQSLTQLMRGLYPDRGIPEEDWSEGMDLGVDLTVFREAGKAEEVLKRMGRRGWTELEESVLGSCESFL